MESYDGIKIVVLFVVLKLGVALELFLPPLFNTHQVGTSLTPHFLEGENWFSSPPPPPPPPSPHTHTLSPSPTPGLPVRDTTQKVKKSRGVRQRGKKGSDDSDGEEWQPWKEMQQTRRKPKGRGVCE